MTAEFRCGIGYDLHRLVEGRKLVLAGVEIPFEKGLAGHSDADVLLHAVTDALLGAAGLGDIGLHFPPSEAKWRDAASALFLEHAKRLVTARGYRVVNVDAVIVIERPKLAPFRDAIRRKLAEALAIDPESVNIKAKTAEGQGVVGEGQAAEAQAVVTICRERTAT